MSGVSTQAAPGAVTEPQNIAWYVPAMAAARPHAQAVIFPEGRDATGRCAYTHLTFRQLEEESNRLARGLSRLGVVKGTRTVLMVKPSLNFFALTFALFKIGAVPIFIDPGMGLKNLKKCLAEAEPQAFIGISKAHIARLLLRWPKIDLLVTVGPRLFWSGATLDELRGKGKPLPYDMSATKAEDTAAILFTSGSTGVPKGVIYKHRTFLTQVKVLKTVYGIEPGEVDLATFPLFALFAPALGMTAVIPDMDATRPALVDPEKIFEPINNFGVTNMFGSPALLNTVGRYGAAHDIELTSLKRVISAGAPVSDLIMERFSRMLNGDTQIFTPYGATESLPVCSIGSHEILRETALKTHHGAGVCVGRPVDGLLVKIIRISDEPVAAWSDDLEVPAGVTGEIVVKGPQVTESYFNREASTDLAKIRDPRDQGIFHRMGDLGYVDELGRVWFCGRKAHRVVTKARTLFTIPTEGVFNAHPNVYRSALVGVPDGAGDVEPVLCVELEKEHTVMGHDELRAELLKLGQSQAHTRDIKRILFHDAFPVDIRHNSKIFREKLAVWAAKQK